MTIEQRELIEAQIRALAGILIQAGLTTPAEFDTVVSIIADKAKAERLRTIFR